MPRDDRRLSAGAEVVGPGHNRLGVWWWLVMAGRVQLDAEGGAVVAQEIGGRVLPEEGETPGAEPAPESSA